MAFVDLSDVTSALTALLRTNINDHLLGGAGPAVTVIPAAPNRIPPASQNHLSLYLYHVGEDPHYKNFLGQGNDAPNVAKAPMALCLYYILTAYHNADDIVNDPLVSQNLMGMALKSFHDNPVITDATNIAGTQILPNNLQNRQNTIQVIMRQLSPEEAVGFWTSEDQQMTVLSAYYEVRVVFLEPEPPRTTPGIVLSVGTYLQQLGSPDLRRSRSQLRFVLPAVAGGAVRTTEASPARATLDDDVSPPAEHRRFTLSGSNLTMGESRQLVLRNSRWQNLTPPLHEAAVDLALNGNWATDFASDRVDVEFRSTLDVQTHNGLVSLDVAPGIYSAYVRIVTRQEVLLGRLKDIVSTSNETAFAITPRIISHDPPNGAGNIVVNLGPEFDLTTLNVPPDQIGVSLAGVAYTLTSANPPADAGEFSISSPNTITLNPANNINIAPAQPEAHSFRLILNGAESAPFWIELP